MAMKQISSELLLDLYSCANEPGRWIAFLDKICVDLGVANAAVQCLARTGDRLDQIWTVRDSTSTARRELHDRLVNNSSNPRLDLAIDHAPSAKRIVRDDDRFAPGCKQYAELRERLHAAGLGESLCLRMRDGPDHFYSLVMHREYGSNEQFGDIDEAYLMELCPHLEQVLDLTARIDEHSDQLNVLHATLDMLRVGIIFSGDGQSVDWANGAANVMLAHSDHLVHLSAKCLLSRFCNISNPVTASNNSQNNRMRATVMGAGQENELQILAVRVGSERTILQTGEDAGVALLLVEPRRVPDMASDELAALLGITRSEGRVATWLAGGGTIKEYAIHRGLSEGSVRNQVKQALAKTGAPRQADLVRHICSSIPSMLIRPVAQVD